MSAPPPRRTGGLGRGLGALIPTGPPAEQPGTGSGPSSSAGPAAAGPVDGRPGAGTDSEVRAGHGSAGDRAVDGGTVDGGTVDGGMLDGGMLDGGTVDGAAVDGGTRSGARFAELPLDAITPNPSQPRAHFDEEALAELVTSIREVGLLQPVVVREIGPGRYELVMGERRWRASQEAGTGTIPAIVRDTADDAMLRDALLENLHRQQLNPLEEAAAYAQLLEDFGTTHDELATRLGRSRPQVSNTLRLLHLPPAVQRRVAAGVLSAGHARAILGLPTAEAQEAMAARVVAEGMSVRAVEEAVALAQAEQPPDARAPRPRARRPVPAHLSEVAERLSDRFETRVKVDLGRSRGKLTIEFATVDDLERIVAVMEGRQPTAEPDDGGAPSA